MIPGVTSLATGYRRLAILLLVLNCLSALVFVVVVRKPVYDDPTNIRDVLRYARDGVNVQSVRGHLNPTGPGSFIWMAAGARLLADDELLGARLAIVVSWLMLGAGLLLADSGSPELWYAALVVTLIFPHTMTATGTLMTEGPALLAAMLGTFAWITSASLPKMTARGAVLTLSGGLAFGLAVTCRQYFLALLPAAALVALFQLRNRSAQGRTTWILAVAGSFVVAAIPIGLLVLMWNGLSSPAMAAGTAYPQWNASLGVNLARPITAIFDVAIWMIPFSFPLMARLSSVTRWIALCGALAAGAAAVHFREGLLQPGPLHSFAKFADHFPLGEVLVVGGMAAAGFYNAVALVTVLRERRAEILQSPPVLFSLFVVLFFVLEQFGIGGNIPFYDRYVLQLAPFLGIISFFALPELTVLRLMAFASLTVFSHAMLWRHALG